MALINDLSSLLFSGLAIKFTRQTLHRLVKYTVSRGIFVDVDHMATLALACMNDIASGASVSHPPVLRGRRALGKTAVLQSEDRTTLNLILHI